ncbi:putative serine/threonine-protein kinase PBL1 [Bidens hawaiensis]|uniref:putative serine/threonine-protein kinase PBL1 n=1 Tax=Bidens hawaiensis TaxID=980011 RepID=UPI00404B0763
MIGSMHANIFVNDGFVNTPGYADPTYLQSGVITKESDVYSFGVVLFEVLCGRETFDRNLNNRPFLGPLARVHYEKGILNKIVDPLLMKQMSQESMREFSAIAYQCLEKLGTARPTMIEIVQKLENVLRIQQDFERALAFQQVALGFKGKQEHKADSYKVKNLKHMKIPLEQIKLATHDFHDDFKIGRGGYGNVYKADLFHFDVQKYFKDNIHKSTSVSELLGYRRRKSTVAVKRLDRRYGQGTAEFLQEISVLPYFRHQNLVTLVGFCDEDQERILVYEYASNGSLAEYISSIDNRNNYSWAQHLQICLDAARDLEFLHNGVGEHHRIIHRDIKSSNILLGKNWVGKISDFGLSRIGPANLQATFVMTEVAGALEYVDPQYHKTGMLTKGSDVYSFGVDLFEVLCGRLAYFQRSKDDQEYIPHKAKHCIEQNKLNELINSKLKKVFEKESFTFDQENHDGKTFPDSVSIFAAIAYKCIQENRDDRPTMSLVVEELEKALKI